MANKDEISSNKMAEHIENIEDEIVGGVANAIKSHILGGGE
jgi:hypothetical protein